MLDTCWNGRIRRGIENPRGQLPGRVTGRQIGEDICTGEYSIPIRCACASTILLVTSPSSEHGPTIWPLEIVSSQSLKANPPKFRFFALLIPSIRTSSDVPNPPANILCMNASSISSAPPSSLCRVIGVLSVGMQFSLNFRSTFRKGPMAEGLTAREGQAAGSTFGSASSKHPCRDNFPLTEDDLLRRANHSQSATCHARTPVSESSLATWRCLRGTRSIIRPAEYARESLGKRGPARPLCHSGRDARTRLLRRLPVRFSGGRE